jgi:putative tricarboxylic transport membrane protein
MADDNLRRGLALTGGDPTPFFTRPISALLLGLVVLTVVGRTALGAWLRRRRPVTEAPAVT